MVTRACLSIKRLGLALLKCSIKAFVKTSVHYSAHKTLVDLAHKCRIINLTLISRSMLGFLILKILIVKIKIYYCKVPLFKTI
jgi:hypothetical protein